MTEKLADDAARFVAIGLTGYDACYAALARQLQGLWLTFDARAHRLIAGEGVSHNLAKGLPDVWL
jgi:predicted nucleic acid-binding protein